MLSFTQNGSTYIALKANSATSKSIFYFQSSNHHCTVTHLCSEALGAATAAANRMHAANNTTTAPFMLQVGVIQKHY